MDKLTNEVVSFPVDLIKISEKFGGVRLNAEQKAELLEGRPVLVEGMVNTKTGEVFNQQLQYSADAKKLGLRDRVKDNSRGRTMHSA
ncbi:DUF3945 domain-containing protein [Sphingobacterium multivorum]|uniref:DUF3945 domain-containing protein n=1 Tax=Sphingobacterium multivorum TaxID=28454 RepID=UPI00351A2919